jgi:succinoglycan biosynthesis protein ExoA
MVDTMLVVIPALNEANTIERVLRVLGQQMMSRTGSAIVVVDGGSNDGTPNIVRRVMVDMPLIRLLNNPARIQSSGINLAVSTYGGEFDVLVRCDAHAIYPDNFLSALERSMEVHGADSIVLPMDSHGVTCFQQAVAWASDSRIGSGGSAHRGGTKSGFVDHGHHAAIKMSTFRKLGGYDDTFSHNEDAEFDCRLRAEGGTIFLDADVRLQYKPRSTVAGLWKQYFNYGRGRSRTVRRHPTSLRLRQFLVPAHVLASFVALAMSPWTVIPLIWPLAYLVVLAGFAILQSVKHRSPCGLLTAVAALVMHTAWAFGFFWGWASIKERPWVPGQKERMAPPASRAMEAFNRVVHFLGRSRRSQSRGCN